jgi:hypothetical protein
MKRDYCDTSSGMTPDQRLTAIARILAAGILRLRSRAPITFAPERPPDSPNSEKARPGLP